MGAGESETTQLPDGLQKFFKVTLGMEWPEGSEGGLRAMSAAWSDFSEALTEASASVSRASGGFDRAMDGKYAAAVVDNLTAKTLPALDEMMAAADDFASSTKNAAADIQKAKIMLISMAAITLATVISLLASLFGAFLVPAVEAAAQVGMRTLISQLIARLGSLTARGVSQAALQSVKSITWKGAGKAALNVAKYPAGGAAIMGGLDLSIQAGQNAAGTRDGIDWDSVGNMAIGGAIGGAGFGAFHGGANAFLKFLPNAGKASPLANAIGHAAYAGGQVLTVGATNPLVNLATGGDDEWWAGMLGGASSYQGSATGGSGHHTRDLIGHVFPSTKPVFEFVNKATSPSYLLGRNGPFAKQLYGKGDSPSTEDGANEPLLSDPPSGEDVVIPGDEDSSYGGGPDLGGDRGGVGGSRGRDVVGADGRNLGTVFDHGGGDRIATESDGRGPSGGRSGDSGGADGRSVTLGGPEQVVSNEPSTSAGNGDPATFDSTADAPEATGGSQATPRAAATGGESSESGPVGLGQDGQDRQGDSSNGSQQPAHEASGGQQQSNGGVSNGSQVDNNQVDGSRAESGESSGSQANTQEPNGGRSSTNESVPTQRTLADPGTSTSTDSPGESRTNPDGSEPQSIGSGRSDSDPTGTDPAAFDRTSGSGENASTDGPATNPSTTERSSEGPAGDVQNGQNSSAGRVDTSQPSPSTSDPTSNVATPPSGQATPQPPTTPQPAPSTSPQPATQSNAQPGNPTTTSQPSTSPPASTPSGGTQSSIPQTTSPQLPGSQATSSQSGPTSHAGQSTTTPPTTTPPTTSQQPATQSSGNPAPSTNQPGQTSTPSTQPPAGESAKPTGSQTPSGKPAPQLDTVTAQSQSPKPAVPTAPPNSPVTPTTPTGATANAPTSEPPKPAGQTSPSQPPPAVGPQSSPATPNSATPPPPPPNTPTSPSSDSSVSPAKSATPPPPPNTPTSPSSDSSVSPAKSATPPPPPNTPTSQAGTPPPSESPAKSATSQTSPAKPVAPVELSTPQGQPPKPAPPAGTQSASETAGPPAKNSSTSTTTTPPQHPRTPENSAPSPGGGHQQTSHAGTEQVTKGKGKAKIEDTAGVVYQPPQPPGTGRNDTGRSEPDGSRGDEPAPFVAPSRDWHAARDRAPVERFSTERRTTANRSGDSHLTQVRFDSRRFQARPGAWVRELTVPVELTSRTGEVSPHERREFADELQRHLDEHVNLRYRFAGGDQLHVSVDARTSSSPSRSWASNRADSVQVDVFDGTKSGGGRAEGQLAWDAQAAPGRQVRNALSFLGVQGRAGVSGPGTRVPRLTRENLHQIAHVLADPNAAPPPNTPAPRRNDARQDVVSHGPRDTPPPPDRTPPPGGGPRPSNRSRRLEPVPEEYELTEFRRNEESTRDTPFGGEPETVSTAALPHETLPDYLRQNRAGGPSKQVAAANGIDIVTGLTEIDRRLADDRTVRTLQTEVTQQTLSFLGNGKRRTVMVDGVPHELSVRAEFDWQELTVRPGKVDPDGTPTAGGPARQEPDQPTHSSDSSAKSSTGTSASRSRDVNLNARATVMPPLVATAKVNMPGGPNTEHSTTTTFDAKRSSEAKGGALTRVDVPVRVHYELSGPAGRGPRESRGTAELDVPTSYRNTAEGTARAPRTLPSRFAVEAAYSEPGRRGDFAEQAWRDLPEHLTELQSDGRRALRELFDDGNLAERLPDMAVVDPAANEGWISSEVLSKGADSKRWRDPKDRLEIRAVARDVQLLETVGDVTHTDTFSGKTGSSSASNTQRGVGGNVHVGAGADTGVVFWSAGPVVGASGTRTKSFEDTTATNTKDVVTVNGDASRYKVTYDVEVRRAGHGATTLDGALHAVQWSRRDRAERAGLYDPDPPSADTTNGDTTNTGVPRREIAAPEREVYAPPHLEYGDSVGGSVVDDFAGGDRLRETITAALRDLPGRKWYHLSTKAFLRSFDAPELRGLSSRANEILARGDDLAAHLSDAELAQLVDTMLGPKGLTFEITKKGVFWDFHTTVNLRGDLGPLRDEATDTAATTGGKRKDRSSTSYEASRSVEGQFGVASRVTGPLGTTVGSYWASVDGSHGRTRGTSFGSAHQESVATTESARTKRDDATLEGQPMRAFLGDLRITPSTQSWVTPTTSTRRFTVGSPGRTAPALVPNGSTPRGRLDPHTVPLRLLVPENLTSRTLGDRDSAHRGDVTELAEPPSIRTLPRADRVFDNADVIAVRGTEHLADAVRRVLGRASDGDPIFRPQRADDGSPRTATLFTDEIEGRFGPDRLAGDPRLFSRPQTTRVNWLRRRADTSAAAAVALTPRSVTPLTPREYGTIKRTSGNTSSVGGSRGHRTTLSSRHDAFDTQQAPASGTTRFSHLVGIGGTPWAKRWGTKHDAGAEAVRKTTFENGRPVSRTLVRVGVDATVVGEVKRTGNLDRWELTGGDGTRTAGESFRIDDAVVLWATDEQLAALERAAERTESPTTPGGHEQATTPEGREVHEPSTTDGRRDGDPTGTNEPRLPTPDSVRAATKPSLGIGGVSSRVDLSSRIDELHDRLVESLGRETAGRLLPKAGSALDDPHDNHGRAAAFLSDVDRSADRALNGGELAPLRLEDRLTGHTYYLGMDARFVGEPRLLGIEHPDKVSAEQSAAVSNTTERSSGRTAAELGLLHRFGPRFFGEKTAESQQAMGAPLVGSMGGAELGKRDATNTTGDRSEHTQSISATGPMASYRGTVQFDLRIERGLTTDAQGHEIASSVVARDTVSVPDVDFLTLPGESFPTPRDGSLGSSGDIRPVPRDEHSPAATDAWRGSGDHALPGTGDLVAEHYFGDIGALRETAERALTESGTGNLDARTVAALKNGITTSMVKAGIEPMTNGDFVLPLPHLDRELEVHVRPSAPPRLATVDANVELEGSRKNTYEASTELRTGTDYRVTATVPAPRAGTTSTATQPRHFDQGTGGFNYNRNLLSRSDQVTATGGQGTSTDTDPVSADQRRTDDRVTRVDLQDVEFRFVARSTSGSRTGVAELAVSDAYALRSNPDPANPLPRELVDSATRLKDAGRAWHDAVRKHDGHALNAGPRPHDRDTAEGLSDVERRTRDAEAAWWRELRAHRELVDAARAAEEAPARRGLEIEPGERPGPRPEGTPGDPTPLHRLVDDLDPSDVDVTRLVDDRGDTAGVFFGRGADAEVLRESFRHAAGRDDTFTVAAHHNADGFAIPRRSTGETVRVSERGLARLVEAMDPTATGRDWRQAPNLLLLSCRVADGALTGSGSRLAALDPLLRDAGYQGRLLGPDTPVRAYESGRVEVTDGGGLRTPDGTPVTPDAEPRATGHDGTPGPGHGRHVELNPGRGPVPPGPPLTTAELTRFTESWLDARIEYERQGQAYEQRLGEYLARHPRVDAELTKVYRAMIDLLPRRERNHIGEGDPEIPGAVGTGNTYQVLRDGTPREKMTMLWSVARDERFARHLGGLPERNPVIEQERSQRRMTEAEQRYQEALRDRTLPDAAWETAVEAAADALRSHQDPDTVRPPMSRRELDRNVRDGRLQWMPASNRMDLSIGPVAGQHADRGDASLHRESELAGGRVTTGTSGSTYLVMKLAQEIERRSGIDVDWPLLRAAFLAHMLPTGIHTYHEVMRAAELLDPRLGYTDDWGRYRALEPFTEQELRDNVAVDGRFPDEHAVDRAAWPEPAADRQPTHGPPTMATLARRLEELDSFFDSSDTESASSPRSTWSDPFDLDDALPPSDPPRRRGPRQPEPGEAFADFSGVHREPSPDRSDEPALELTEEQLWEPEDATTPERVTTVPFEQRHHALSAAGHRAVRTLGLGMFREFLRQHRAGEPFTRVSVVGYGNSRTHGRRTGLARAETVRRALLDVLGGERERAARFGADLPAFTNQHVSVFSAGRADEPRTTGEGVAERRRAAAVHLHGLPPLGAAVELGGGTLADPAPLHELVDGPLDLSDVDHTPLRDESGRTVGVAFPRPGEGDTLRAAFEHGAGRDGAYTVAAHHNADGFAVRRRSDGAEVRIDEHGMRRLLEGTSLPGGQAWRQGAELVLLSCRVADAGIGNRLGAFADLLRGDGYRGDVLGPAGKATVYESGRVDYSGEGTRAGLRRADGSLAPETTPDAVPPARGAHVDLQPARGDGADGNETGQGPRRHEVNRFNRSWLDARIEYERRSAAFERRLGEYLAGHPDVTRTVDDLYEAMLDQLPPAARALAGETEPTIAGAVGQGARATNLREKLTAIWSIGRRSHLAQSLGELPGRHPEIENERHQRRSTEAEEAYRRALEDTSLTGERHEDAVAGATDVLRSDVDPGAVRPPLSDRERERAVADDGGLRWLPADKRKELSVDRVDGQPENRDGSLHRESEPTGGRVSTGTSGSTYLLLRLARRISDNAGLQLDMRLVRAAIVSQLVPTGMHTFHEVMRAAELADETLRYQDDWGRYRSLAPFGEQELRDSVAVDGRFPDEHALERVSWPFDASTPLRSREPFTLSDVLPERLWWRLFLEPGDHPAAALTEDPATLYDHPGAGQGMPGLSRGVLDAYREFLDTPGASRLTSAEYKRMHETVTRHLEKTPDWSGRKTTNFPVRADRVHPEVLAERVGGRPLAADPRDPGFSLRDDRPLTVVNSWRGDGPAVLSTAYRQGEAPGIADAIFEAYYDDLARSSSDRERLEAIGRAVRNLYVAQLFEDANSRVTRKLVLPKLLLENGFLPVVHPDMRTLFQGGSAVAPIADVLEAGQRSELGREAVDLAREEFEQARREYDGAVHDRLAADDGDPARAGERVEAAMDRLTRAIERITALDTPNAEEPSVTLGDPDDAPMSPPPREPEEGTVFDTLVDLSNQADERPVPPLPDTGGVFGTPGPRPRPSGVDPLPDGTGERAASLDGVDLTRDPSLDAGAEAARAPSEPPRVEHHEPGERRYTWAGADRHRLPPLPGVLELPRLVHSVWLSGVLRSAETIAAFRANLERTLHAAGEGWKAVVWTDISRERFLDAVLSALPERPPLSRLVPVRHGDDEDDDRVPPGQLAELLDWARGGNVALVNIDEVFHDDEPMDLRDSYDDELARGDDEGLDNAADILGNEILDRFGGLSIRPDRYATELDSALDAPRGDTGWGLGDGAAVVPRGHPVTDSYREHLRDRLDHANPYAARRAAAVPVSLPLLDGFVPGEAPPVALDAPAASLSVAEGAKRAIDVLVRKLVATGGELDLAGVSRLIEGSEQAPEIWTVVLGFLATHPEYADLVHGVTIGSFDERGLPVSVPLPAKAAELIAFTEGPRSPGGPGVDTRAATLNWPEWL